MVYTNNVAVPRQHKAFDVPLEYQEQTELVEVLAWHGITAVHVPNGGQRSIAGHKIAKGMGEQKGFPDLMILNSPPAYPEKRVFVEMKRRKGGTQSDEQREWEHRINAMGDIYILAKGADDAIEKLRAFNTGWKI